MIKQNEVFELNSKKMFFESNSVIDFENGEVLKSFPKIEKIYFQDDKYFFSYNIEIPMVGVCKVYYGVIKGKGDNNISIEKGSFESYSQYCEGDLYYEGKKFNLGKFNHGTSRPGKTDKKITKYEILNKKEEKNDSITSTGFTLEYSKFSYSGNLHEEPFKEILAFQDGKVYLSYDGFSYFLIFCISGILLFKLFIKISKESFNLGFNFFKKGKG